MDVDGLLDRVQTYLNISRDEVEIKKLKSKICDLKPMWPTLFPEISQKHEFVGFADADVLFGDLAGEVAALGPEDDVLVPSSWHPFPLANGNFMLFRSEPRVLDVFRGAKAWRKAVRSPGYSVFDEWHGRGDKTDSFMHALLEAHLTGAIRPRPTRRLFVQDVMSGGRALWARPAKVVVTWARGALRVAYDGPRGQLATYFKRTTPAFLQPSARRALVRPRSSRAHAGTTAPARAARTSSRSSRWPSAPFASSGPARRYQTIP